MQKAQTELYFLNTIRWISAFIVAGGHATGMVFKDPPISHSSTWIRNLVTYCSDLGHPAVMIFFVISGYLVGGGVLDRLAGFDARSYAISRFSRIYIALVPALLLTLGLDGLAYLTAPTSPVYTTSWAGPVGHAVFGRYTVQNFLATIFSFESVFGDALGSDGPLWSLGYEWFFYILFPLALLAVRRTRAASGQLLAMGAVVLLMMVTGKKYMTIYWLIWVAGAYAKVAANRELVPLWVARLGGAAAVLGFLVSPMVNQRITDPIIGLGFALFVANRGQLYASLNKNVDHYLASFSYSLYIVHLPLMTFLTMLLVNAGITTTGRLEFGLRGVLIWLLLVGVGIAVAALFGHLFERRTDELRRFLQRRFMVGRIAAPAPAAVP